MASLVPVPETILDELRRRQNRLKGDLGCHLAVYDSLMQKYRVFSGQEWRNFELCDGYDPDRYRIVASTQY